MRWQARRSLEPISLAVRGCAWPDLSSDVDVGCWTDFLAFFISRHIISKSYYPSSAMEGYEKLARLMGNSHTDGHFLIFQKFESLSAQNILYLQAEIVNLQEILAGLAKEDGESDDPEKRTFARDWFALSSTEDCEQWETFLRLRSRLKEYCTLYSSQTFCNRLMEGSRRGNSPISDDL